MFEEEILLGVVERCIRLDTHLGTPIPNSIGPEPDEKARQFYERIRKKFGSRWINRKPATGVYNCFGMVFASRRTSILDNEVIRLILKEDGYRRLSTQTDLHTGDIVLYRDCERDDIYHVAMVTRWQPLVMPSDSVGAHSRTGACYVLSKWDRFCGEDEHHIEHHCWVDADVQLEYWTDRPEL